jgi:hypothetical protein
MSYFILDAKNSYKSDLKVEVYSESKLVETINLSVMEFDKVYKNKYGKNVVYIKNGKAYMKDADCRDQICVNSNPIDEHGERIVCLPNQFWIEIKGKAGEAKLDDIAY